MEKAEILKKIKDVFIDVLDNKEILLTETTTANDVEEWDSLTNIQIIVEMEKQFKVRFTAKEMQNWKNVGEIINCIGGKI